MKHTSPIRAALAVILSLCLFFCGCGKTADPAASPGPATAPPSASSATAAPAPVPETPAAAMPSAPPEAVQTAASAGEAVAPTQAPSTDVPVVREQTEVTALQPLLGYTAPDGDAFTIDAGTVFSAESSDGSEWLACSDGEERFLLHLDPDNPYRVETPEGWLFLWVALDGLDFH